ncbi:MAG: MarC family protein [Candidatus Micrarchaeota archaeon]
MLDFVLILQLFVLLNPITSFSVLMDAYKKKMNVKKIAINAVLLAFAIAIIMVFVGPLLFTAFGVTLDSFKVAGGVVLFLLGLDTIRHTKHSEEEVNEVDGLISIIATPLLTGPATISFITIKTYELGQMPVVLNLIATFVMIMAIFVIFSSVISKINTKILSISSKIFGLFLTAMAIDMMAKGLSVLLLGAK